MGWWGKKFGHDYHPIYDTVVGEPTLDQVNGRVNPGTMAQVIEASKPRKKTYVYSICRRCGDRVYRVDKESS
jgi:hypothetical protein